MSAVSTYVRTYEFLHNNDDDRPAGETGMGPGNISQEALSRLCILERSAAAASSPLGLPHGSSRSVWTRLAANRIVWVPFPPSNRPVSPDSRFSFLGQLFADEVFIRPASQPAGRLLFPSVGSLLFSAAATRIQRCSDSRKLTRKRRRPARAFPPAAFPFAELSFAAAAAATPLRRRCGRIPIRKRLQIFHKLSEPARQPTTASTGTKQSTRKQTTTGRTFREAEVSFLLPPLASLYAASAKKRFPRS